MSRRYITLDQKVLDLDSLNQPELAFFERCLAAYRAEMPYSTLANWIDGRENPLLEATEGWITAAVWHHPLFRAVEDLKNRLGVTQGKVGPMPGGEPRRDPMTGETLRQNGRSRSGRKRAAKAATTA